MPTVLVDELRHLATEIVAAAGTPSDLASIVGESLVDANLAGHDSHGVMRLCGYVAFVRAGDVQPAARARVTHRDRATGRVDGAWGWGQPAMHLATDTALDLARAHGVGCVVVNRCFHIGRVIPYVEKAAREGMVAIAMSNAGPAVAPYGGCSRLLGTNPFAWAVPRGEGQEPLSFDIATAAIAEGKLQVARAKGECVPPGMIVTPHGRPTINPIDFFDGGAILPFGGHKGYGLNLLAQVLGCGLAGMDTSGYEGPAGANGPLIVVIDIPPFADPAQFAREINGLCGRISASPPAADVEAVRLPGDQARAHRRTREKAGVPIPDATWAQITALAAQLGVEVEVATCLNTRS
jgi:LDH2 family malate/lactate/ureidoglycolate dehydrogenase